MKADEQPPHPLKLGLLGTMFSLHGCGSDWHDVRARSEGVYKAILDHCRESIRRQKRPFIAYWDALTYLESREGSADVATDEHGLLLELSLAMQEPKIPARSVMELTEHPLLKTVRSRLIYHKPDPKTIAQHALQRGLSAQLVMDAKGKLRQKEEGFYREFELDLGREHAVMAIRNIKHLVVLAVLVQFKADLEVYYETGFRRLRRCENGKCHSWFAAPAMGSRQRFCSTLCRVQANREM